MYVAENLIRYFRWPIKLIANIGHADIGRISNVTILIDILIINTRQRTQIVNNKTKQK